MTVYAVFSPTNELLTIAEDAAAAIVYVKTLIGPNNVERVQDLIEDEYGFKLVYDYGETVFYCIECDVFKATDGLKVGA